MYIIVNNHNVIIIKIIDDYETAERIKNNLLTNFSKRFRNTELYIYELKKIE